MRQISHDPFARVTTYKQVSRKRRPVPPPGEFTGAAFETPEGCKECGSYDRTGRVHRFSNHSDDKNDAPTFSRHEFCGVACWRAYNA